MSKHRYSGQPVRYVPVLFTAEHAHPGMTEWFKDREVILQFPPYVDSYEECSDSEPGPRGNWKSFQHYKCVGGTTNCLNMVKVSTAAFAPNYYGWGFGWCNDPMVTYDGGYGEGGQLNNGLPPFNVGLPDGGFVPPPDILNRLVDMSLRTMLPTIKSELSLLNTLYELKDFSSLKSTLGNVLAWSDKFRRVGNLGRTLHVIADSFLQLKFNILPLLSDLCGISTALSTYERRLNDLVSREGKTRRMHYAYKWVEFKNSHEQRTGSPHVGGFSTYLGPTSPVGLMSVADYERDTFYEPSVFHAEIEYNYNYTQYQREHSRVLGLLDKFGVNVNPRIFWNAIPWSFVVDWVIGVNQWLDSQRMGNMDPLINIHRYLWSVKRKRTIQVSSLFGCLQDWSSSSAFRSSKVSLPVVTETSYRRTSELPSVGSFETSGLSPMEFSLASALVVTSRRRRRH